MSADRLYDVTTERFGVVTIAADDIADARKRAKKAYRAGPRCVAPHVDRAKLRPLCEGCSCRPCLCGGRS